MCMNGGMERGQGQGTREGILTLEAHTTQPQP